MRRFGCSLLLAALLSVAGAAHGQAPGDKYRAPIRRIEVVTAGELYITYRVLESELSPSTVGRSYRVSRGTFAKSYVLDSTEAPAEPKEPAEPAEPTEPTQPAPTPTPPPPPAPAPPPNDSFSAPDLAFADFENASTAPFTTANGGTAGNADISLISGAVRIRYARLSTGTSADVNRALRWVHPTGVGLGQTVYFRGHVLIPTPAANMLDAQRKLFYVQRQQNDVSFFFLKQEMQKLKVELTGNRVFSLPAFGFDRKYSIEVQITCNTAVGTANGVLRIWLDGVLVLDRSDIAWLTSTAPFKVFLFGQQAQHVFNDLSVTFDEYRYWDQLAVSTKRIGP